MSDGLDHEDGVAPVDCGQGVAEADGGSGGDAGSQFEHVPFPEQHGADVAARQQVDVIAAAGAAPSGFPSLPTQVSRGG